MSLSLPAPRRARPRAGRILRAAALARPWRGTIAVIALLTLVIAALNALEPLVLKYLFDDLAAGRAGRALATGTALLLAIGGLRELAGAASNWLTWQTRLGFQYQLLERTVDRLYHLPPGAHHEDGVGAVLTRLDRSIQGFVEAVSKLLFHVLPAVVYLGLSLVLMLQLHATLALVVLAFAPLPALIAAWAAPEQAERERTLLDRWARIYSRFHEVLSSVSVVRSFTMEGSEKRRFLRDVAGANQVVLKGVGVDGGFAAAGNLTVMLARVAAIAAGCTFIARGEITVGTLVAFLGFVGGLFGPVQGLSGVYQAWRRASVSLDEVFAILDTEDHVADRPGAIAPRAVRGDIAFEHVRFSYPTRALPVLDGVSLAVPAGMRIAIVGPSGSGKTTLSALLLRLHDPQRGRVTLDGRDLRDLQQHALRRHIAVVLQDPLLFNDTVRNNIAYGRPDATDADVERAARAAHAHEFIARLPEGYDTRVGERGARLSLGERQRLTIARALAKDAAVVVLDEATSSLDAESEAMVQDALDHLTHGRTTLIIAHRLSTVVAADRIVVLQHGRITESGTHAELMSRRGYYASLVARQTRGLILVGEDDD